MIEVAGEPRVDVESAHRGTTIAIKGVGAVLSSQTSSTRVSLLLERLTPLLVRGVLASLIVVQVFSTDRHLTIDARAMGLLAAIVAVRLRASPALILVAAALTTAIGRLIYAQATGKMS